ncbi:MAG TPA: transporter [Xanthobacteraceae bacterium]|nr:transporter [Xanthobacteraceae bacterium]
MRRDGNKDWGVGVRVACVLACLGVLAAGGADAGDSSSPAALNPPAEGRALDPNRWFDFIAGLFAVPQDANKAKNKDQYTVFNPTPPALMRELTTDRPDNTESPFTVDAGHFQTETTLFGYTRSDRSPDGSVSDSYEFGTTDLRMGLTNSAEMNLIWQPYGIVRTHAPNPTDSMLQSGIGGLEIRGKINLWGGDAFENPGSTAFALLPFISVPTDRGNGVSPDAVEGGLILPYAIKLTETFDITMNAGVEAIHNDGGAGYHPRYIASASLGHDWTEQLTIYYEVYAELAPASNFDVVLLSTGVTYQVTKNVQFDSGINLGVTPAADRFNPFVGASFRF